MSPSLTCSVFLGLRVGSTDPTAGGDLTTASYWPTGMQTGSQSMSMIRKLTLAAGAALQMRMRHNAAATCAISAGGKAMELQPIRVG